MSEVKYINRKQTDDVFFFFLLATIKGNGNIGFLLGTRVRIICPPTTRNLLPMYKADQSIVISFVRYYCYTLVKDKKASCVFSLYKRWLSFVMSATALFFFSLYPAAHAETRVFHLPHWPIKKKWIQNACSTTSAVKEISACVHAFYVRIRILYTP